MDNLELKYKIEMALRRSGVAFGNFDGCNQLLSEINSIIDEVTTGKRQLGIMVDLTALQGQTNATEILQHTLAGQFKVGTNRPPHRATKPWGDIKRINFDKHGVSEVGVVFPGTDWHTWFQNSHEEDKQKHYIRELQLISDRQE